MSTPDIVLGTVPRLVSDNPYREFQDKGYVVFERAIPPHLVAEMYAVWADYFGPYSRRRPEMNRFLMHSPFKWPLYEPRFVENPLVLQIADRALGKHYICGYFGSETPLPGAAEQEPHFDLAFRTRFTSLNGPLNLLNKLLGSLGYCYGIQVSVPLVESTAINAPFEIWPGTNRFSLRRQRPELVTMPAGSILVRDIRNRHRGTTHRGDRPRPFLSLVYLRSWVPAWRPPEIPSDIYRALPPKSRHLFRRARIGEAVPDPAAWAQRARH
jgi:hypothetical protein